MQLKSKTTPSYVFRACKQMAFLSVCMILGSCLYPTFPKYHICSSQNNLGCWGVTGVDWSPISCTQPGSDHSI